MSATGCQAGGTIALRSYSHSDHLVVEAVWCEWATAATVDLVLVAGAIQRKLEVLAAAAAVDRVVDGPAQTSSGPEHCSVGVGYRCGSCRH